MKTLKSTNPIDVFIKIIILSILLVWSFYITKPFILLIVWSILIAVTLYPFYKKVIAIFKGKKKGLVTAIFVVVLLAIIITPTVSVTQSIVDSSKGVFENFNDGTLQIPSPDTSVKNWPFIGDILYEKWFSVSNDMQSFLLSHPDEIKSSAGWFFSSFTGLMGSVFLSLIALIVAGVFMSVAEEGHKTGVAFANKLVNGKGIALIEMCTNTIRSVVKGILMVAVIQGVLAFVGFNLIGLESTAGLLAFAVMFGAIIQIPVSLIVLPIIIYVFSFANMTSAIIFTIYIVLVSLLDNILKPMLLAKGLQTPMIIIMVGAIGGMMYQGILGLFIGPVVLAITHRLYTNWANDSELV